MQLARLLAGLRTIGADEEQAWRIVRKIALDSIPDLRRNLLARIVENDQTTQTLATACGYPTTTVRRACEDLCAHKIIQRIEGGPGKADTWIVTLWLRERWCATERRAGNVPGTSEDAPLLKTQFVVSDFSGTLGANEVAP